MYNLFLDDERNPVDGFIMTKNSVYYELDWVVVKNYKEFAEYIEKHGVPSLISFDHDLGDIHYDVKDNVINYSEYKEKTGYDCAHWLINYCIDNKIRKLPAYLIHTGNTVGGINIKYLMENYKRYMK